VGDARSWGSTRMNLSPQKKVTSAMITPVSISGDSQSKASTQSEIGTGFDQSGFVESDDALYVVNMPERESDTARVDESEFRRSLGLEELVADEEKNISKMAINRIEIWPWLASVLLMVLVFEFALSNRTPA